MLESMESQVETQSSLRNAVEDLEAFMGNLNALDRKFADSLINGPYGFKKKGTLTEKQTPYIYKLLNIAVGTVDTDNSYINLEVSRILAMFTKAKTHLKFPKVVFETAFGKVRIWIQGEKAKYPGSVVVFLNGAWLGRIHLDGRFQKGQFFAASERKEELLDLLVAFSKDPEGVASHYGKLHSKCVFCMSGLNDPKSLAVGYGPVCAKHFGLKWGKEKFDMQSLTDALQSVKTTMAEA